MSKLQLYREGRLALPAENLAWQLYGAGLQNFGRDGKPASLPMPRYGPDELLARVDAVGICFSDVKIINQGSAHPRLTGRDLARDPVIPGHEVSLTVVGVGEDLQGQFAVGQKYVVQADVYYRGANLAFGYALPGGMAQYVVLGDEVLRGDEGCYLIPVMPETGYAEAALTEPWACVVASYRITPRREMKKDGVALFVGPPAGWRSPPPAEWRSPNRHPGTEGSCELPPGSRPRRAILAAARGCIDASGLDGAEVIEVGDVGPGDLLALAQERTGGSGFDDIIVLGRTEPELVEALGKHLARGGVLNMVADRPVSRTVQVDVGRVHYDGILYVGGGSIREGYERSRESELLQGGAAWFIGAAGPMGQMHVERAVAMKNGPSHILATDIDTTRLDTLRDKVEAAAQERGVHITFVNPAAEGEAGLDHAVEELTGGRGFDDIVVLAPVPALIEQACAYVADGCLMNIFAGLPRGTIASLDITAVYQRGVRWVGSSGSRPDDLEYTLSQAESGNLETNRSVAAIGGIDAVGEGVRAVKEARFPGKTVIFPQIADLPLVALPDLATVLPNVYAKLEDGRFWTREAEEELLACRL